MARTIVLRSLSLLTACYGGRDGSSADRETDGADGAGDGATPGADAHSGSNLSISTAGGAGGALVTVHHFDGFGQGELRSTTPFDALLA